MSGAVAMSFGALASGAVERSSCLAYWIGPCDVEALDDLTATGITNAMSYQYDIEDQADRIGRLMAEDVDWREHFAPVAPVQLARAWSPLPTALALLGPPDLTSVEPDPSGMGTYAAGCGWASPHADMSALTPVRRDSPDEERFRRLLTVTLMRAGDRYGGILIAAKPGWSYEHTTTASDATRRLMDAAGFVVYDRHA